MDKQDFKIALSEIKDEDWEVNRKGTSLYYIYPDSYEDIDNTSESICVLTIINLDMRLSPYIRVGILREQRSKNTGHSMNVKKLFEVLLYHPRYYKYKKLYRKKRREEKRRFKILKKRENMKELPKSLQRSLNIDKILRNRDE